MDRNPPRLKSLESSLTPLDRLLYDSDQLRIGQVVAPAEHPGFREDGPVHNHAVQFYWTSVAVETERGLSVCDPSAVALFARGDHFRRRLVSPEGELSLWIAFDPEALLQTHPEAERLMEGSGRFSRGRLIVESAIYRDQMLLAAGLAGREFPDRDLWVEEQALALLRAVFRLPPNSPAKGRNRELVEGAREYLSVHCEDRCTLSEVSSALGVSSFRLASYFRSTTGLTLHRYKTRLRLNSALPRLLGGEDDLTSLAFDLGFSSHSHFSFRFGSEFGTSPSDFRRRVGGDNRKPSLFW